MPPYATAGKSRSVSLIRLKARHLPKQAVRGHAVIAAGDLADEQLDGFLVLLAQGHKLHRDTFVEAA
jgi:hypothetical protein